jgi:hypothetical protein
MGHVRSVSPRPGEPSPQHRDPDVLHDLLLEACSRAAEAHRAADAAVTRAAELRQDFEARRSGESVRTRGARE